MRLRLTASPTGSPEPKSDAMSVQADGIEQPGQESDPDLLPGRDCQERFDVAWPHLKLLHVRLVDQTDLRDELAMPDEYLLHPNDASLALCGCLFALEDPLTGQGLVLLKESPLPPVRPADSGPDLRISGSGQCWYQPGSALPPGPRHPDWPMAYRVGLYGHGIGPDAHVGECWSVLVYAGGRRGRAEAIQSWLRCLRVPQPGLDGVLVSNTWGDRSRDGRISERFLLGEIRRAAQLGVDVVQIDDGWQKGTTSNSVNAAAGGVWEGFHQTDPDFWTPHPQRLPNGLEPLVELSRDLGVRLGLWFAPDSSDDFAYWREDARILTELHHRYGVAHFKIDGVDVRSPVGLRRIESLFDLVCRQTAGRAAFDLDTTAQRRGGYFRFVQAGALFLENRYTDSHRYWPHQTLRNLWQLAEWVDPIRLQVEWLNPERNASLYADDPLAPGAYPPETIFATAMMASPLAWCELTGLDAQFVGKLQPLVRTWRQHRQGMQAGTILPIGDRPDGTSWTGFVSYTGQADGYLLVFREHAEQNAAEIRLPGLAGSPDCQVLYGRGRCAIQGGRAQVCLARPLEFLWARFG
jgi:alpha-galactosidase